MFKAYSESRGKSATKLQWYKTNEKVGIEMSTCISHTEDLCKEEED